MTRLNLLSLFKRTESHFQWKINTLPIFQKPAEINALQDYITLKVIAQISPCMSYSNLHWSEGVTIFSEVQEIGFVIFILFILWANALIIETIITVGIHIEDFGKSKNPSSSLGIFLSNYKEDNRVKHIHLKYMGFLTYIVKYLWTNPAGFSILTKITINFHIS